MPWTIMHVSYAVLLLCGVWWTILLSLPVW